MKKLRLNLNELHVESFAALEKGGVKALSEPGGGTHSLDYATHCDCSGGPLCTRACVEYSQATDILACCG